MVALNFISSIQYRPGTTYKNILIERKIIVLFFQEQHQHQGATDEAVGEKGLNQQCGYGDEQSSDSS